MVLALPLYLSAVAELSADDAERRICVAGPTGAWVCGTERSPPQARPTRIAPPPPPIFIADPRRAGQPDSPFAAEAEFRDDIDGVEVPPDARMPSGFLPGISAVEPAGPRPVRQAAVAASAAPPPLQDQPSAPAAQPAETAPEPVREARVVPDEVAATVERSAEVTAQPVQQQPAPADLASSRTPAPVQGTTSVGQAVPATAMRGNSEFLALPASSYVLQLASSDDKQAMAAFAQQSGVAPERLFVLEIRRNSTPWWLLIWAPFDSADSARQALASLDLDASSSLWPRRTGPLQNEARRVQR